MSEKKFVIFSPQKCANEAEPPVAGGGDGKTSEDDRRRHQRFRAGVLTEITDIEGRKLPGITFDVSKSGAYLMTLSHLEPGSEITLHFIADDDERETRRARVVHGSKLDTDVFWSQGVGIEFVEGAPSFFEVEFDPS